MGKSVRIGLNLFYFRPDRVSGGETYARGLIRGLQGIDSRFDFFIFVNANAVSIFSELEADSNFHVVPCVAPTERTQRHLWEQLRLPGLCKKHEIDLLHSLGNVSPLLTPCASAVTIHDLLYKHASSLSMARRLFYAAILPLCSWLSDGVLTVSKYSREDLINLLKVPVDKVFLTPEGPGQEFGEPADWKTVKKKYKIPDQYFLSIGTGEHKRVDVSVEAIRLLRRRNIDTHLVLAGEEMESTADFESNCDFTWLGFVPEAELHSLYKHATALVCSSEMEGFGLPVLEAMSAGTPVIATDRGSLPEVVGAGGLLVECGNASALAEMMEKMVKQPQLGSDLRESGLAQAEAFSWNLCAAATVQAYEVILKRRDHSESL